MKATVGIDLGTTNTTVAMKVIDTQTIELSTGEDIIPSSVYYHNSEQGSRDCVIGRAALAASKLKNDQVVTSFKRYIGRDYIDQEVKKLINQPNFALEAIEATDYSGEVQFNIGHLNLKPQNVASDYLKKLCEEMPIEVGSAVVTVPAYFSDRQKNATKLALENAGVSCLRLLPESTAAAISWESKSSSDVPESGSILIFDFGGGTFDLSLLVKSSNQYMEMTKGGDMWLGGDDIDHLIIQWISESIEKDLQGDTLVSLMQNLELSDRLRFSSELKEAAERAKIKLSSEPSAAIELFGILRDRKGALIDIELVLTQEKLSELLNPICLRISELVRSLIRSIEFSESLVDRVLMVGGSSLIPCIRNVLTDIFGEHKVVVHPEPMRAVALGAAILAHKLSALTPRSDDIQLMDSAAHSYYIQLANGNKECILEKNAPLPATITKKFTLCTDSQVMGVVRILEESDNILENVGEVWVAKQGFAKSPFENVTWNFASSDAGGWNLKIDIDCDNIVSVAISSDNHPERAKRKALIRDGREQKLYAELDAALQRTSRFSNDNIGVLKIVGIVIDGIESLTRESTSQGKLERFANSQLQIQCFEKLIEANPDIAGICYYATHYLDLCKKIMSHEQIKAVEKKIEALKHAVDSLVNMELIIALANEVKDLCESDKDIDELTEHKIVSQSLRSSSYVKDADRMSVVIDRIAKRIRDGKKSEIYSDLNELYSVRSQFTTDSKDVSLRRDIRLMD
jgi:molecular chaperone DnaK